MRRFGLPMTSLTSLVSSVRRPWALFVFALLGLSLAAPAAHALTNDELLPANLVGKTLTFTYSAATPNTLESLNDFTILFTSATSYVRSGTGFSTASGTYTVLDSSIAASTGGRATTIQINNNWYSAGSTAAILLVLTQANGNGAYAASEFFNPLKNTGGLFTIGGGSTGGGTTTTAPVISGGTQLTATVGVPFSYQIVASPAATSFSNEGGSATVNISPGTGLVTGTFQAAGTFTFSTKAINSAGASPTTTFTVTVTGGSTTTAPVVTSATTATATVGTPFTYQITATPAATSYTNAGGNAPIQINPTTGLVTGTFTTAGTFTFSYTAANAIGGTKATVVTVTVTGGSSTGGGGSTTTGLGAGLVAYYKFEGNADDSAGSNNGTALNGVTYVPSRVVNNSNFGSAASFNGRNQAITVPHNASLNIGTALTVSLWVNTTNPLAAGGGSRLLEKQTYGVADGWNFDTYDISRQSRNVVRLNASTVGANSTPFNPGVWQHLAFVYNNGTVTFYVNGNAAGTAQVGTLPNNTLPLFIGGPRNSPLSTPEYFSGLMDEVRIYNRILTIGEIQNLSEGDQSTTGLGTTVATNVTTAPANLVGYRNKVGSVFQFTVTGSNTGAIWGTDVYTDDSSVATAAVHAGVLAVGETKTVTITILPGQSSYTASTRNNIKASSWGPWTGSYSFAGAGTVTGTSVATARPTLAPGFTFSATSYAAGGRLVIPISVIGGGTYTYQWYLNNVLIAGATANPYIVDTLTTANAGAYTVDVTNALGTTRLTAATITVGATGSPVISLQPISKTVVPGATFTLATNASGSGLGYQWLRNGTALAGETGAILLRQNVTAADAGSYTVRITNGSGTVTSSAATITLSPDASRPANISVRTNVATGATVIPGFVLQGSGSKRVLIRAVGPGLAAFGLTGTMPDPKFSVYQGNTKIAENDDWTAANIGNAFTATGAFNLPAGSKDAALVTDLAAGQNYTVQVTNASGTGGIVLIEVYDADALKGTSTSKLVNVSVRGQSGPGDDVLTLGLVIGGIGPRTLLVRGVGPKLASFGVTGTIPDPSLRIIDSQGRVILSNDDWSTADFVTELALATNYVGAFALDAGSKDAATLSLVDPGAYTIQVSGAASAPKGEALVEVYEVP